MHDLFVVYDFEREKMGCAAHTLVIKNRSLGEKFPGGIKAFFERHGSLSNRDITVSCDMGSEVDEKCRDLIKNNLVECQDFWYFNFWTYGMSIVKPEPYQPHEIDTGVDWLKGEFAADGRFRVWYVEDADRAEHSSYWEAFRLLKLDRRMADPQFPVLEAGLRDIISDPRKGIQYVKDHKDFLKEQMQTVVEF